MSDVNLVENETVECLRVHILPTREDFVLPVFKDGDRNFVVFANNFDNRRFTENFVYKGIGKLHLHRPEKSLE